MFEKALDACATSPFARGITQWVLAGKPFSAMSHLTHQPSIKMYSEDQQSAPPFLLCIKKSKHIKFCSPTSLSHRMDCPQNVDTKKESHKLSHIFLASHADSCKA